MTWAELLMDGLTAGGPLLLLLGMVRGGAPDDEAAVLEAVRGGDAAAYRVIVERYQDRVYQVLYGMLRNREDARDLTQDTFVKAYRSLHTFRADAKLSTWLHRIAMNLAIDLLRRRKRGAVTGAEEDVALTSDRGVVTEAHHEQSPRRALERKGTYSAIMDALEQLPEEQKQVILLRELDGLSYKEIAEVVGIAEGTVMSRLFYARKKLQTMLADLRDEA